MSNGRRDAPTHRRVHISKPVPRRPIEIPAVVSVVLLVALRPHGDELPDLRGNRPIDPPALEAVTRRQLAQRGFQPGAVVAVAGRAIRVEQGPLAGFDVSVGEVV